MFVPTSESSCNYRASHKEMVNEQREEDVTAASSPRPKELKIEIGADSDEQVMRFASRSSNKIICLGAQGAIPTGGGGSARALAQKIELGKPSPSKKEFQSSRIVSSITTSVCVYESKCVLHLTVRVSEGQIETECSVIESTQGLATTSNPAGFSSQENRHHLRKRGHAVQLWTHHSPTANDEFAPEKGSAWQQEYTNGMKRSPCQ